MSGGSTLFKNFDRRLEKQIQSRVNNRLKTYYEKSGVKSKEIGVNVTKSLSQQHSVWLGGSTFATMVFIFLINSLTLIKMFILDKNISRRAQHAVDLTQYLDSKSRRN